MKVLEKSRSDRELVLVGLDAAHRECAWWSVTPLEGTSGWPAFDRLDASAPSRRRRPQRAVWGFLAGRWFELVLAAAVVAAVRW